MYPPQTEARIFRKRENGVYKVEKELLNWELCDVQTFNFAQDMLCDMEVVLVEFRRMNCHTGSIYSASRKNNGVVCWMFLDYERAMRVEMNIPRDFRRWFRFPEVTATREVEK